MMSTASSSSTIPKEDRPNHVPKSDPSDADPFSVLPDPFDMNRFQPPGWAKDMSVNFDRTSPTDKKVEDDGDAEDNESLGLSEQDTLWEDAREELDEVVDDSGEFTLAELKRLHEKASKLKLEGNGHFTSKPPKYDDAIQSYREALTCLPIPKPAPQDPNLASSSTTRVDEESTTAAKPIIPQAPIDGSGIRELTEAEAAALEAELNRVHITPQEEDVKRDKTEEEEKEDTYELIKELRKVCLGNLGQVYLSQVGKEKECVEACTEAIKLEPKYIKGLQRRATANERLNTWSSLTSAQEDYTTLLSLLPHSSLSPIRRSLATLPGRITAQQEKEKDEMMSKLKDLGNSLLGNFGLSTDMFKFDPQEGGGYSMRFER